MRQLPPSAVSVPAVPVSASPRSSCVVVASSSPASEPSRPSASAPRAVGRAPRAASAVATAHALRPVALAQPQRRRRSNDFDGADHLDAKRVKRLDRFGQFAVVARDSSRSPTRASTSPREDRERVGAMMGTALGGIGYAEGQAAAFVTGGLRGVDATLALAVFGGAASCNMAIEFGVHGPELDQRDELRVGHDRHRRRLPADPRRLRRRDARRRRRGAAEPLCFGAFAIIRAMSTRNDDPAAASRPFDRDRDGFVMGEGARGARARGARARAGPRRADLRRDGRLRHDERCATT